MRRRFFCSSFPFEFIGFFCLLGLPVISVHGQDLATRVKALTAESVPDDETTLSRLFPAVYQT
jgi:hypothetical protein